MDVENLGSKVKGWFSRSAKASKSAMEIAGGKVQNFADKNVVKLEKKQLQAKRDKVYKDLGKKISMILDRENGEGLEIKNEEDKSIVMDFQKEIQLITKEISDKEKEMN